MCATAGGAKKEAQAPERLLLLKWTRNLIYTQAGLFRWPRAKSPTNPVLFYNPLSGGGKAARFHLADEARRRGIEPIELRRGDDLETLVRDAVARGADALAMAGGDGSQAIVATVTTTAKAAQSL